MGNSARISRLKRQNWQKLWFLANPASILFTKDSPNAWIAYTPNCPVFRLPRKGLLGSNRSKRTWNATRILHESSKSLQRTSQGACFSFLNFPLTFQRDSQFCIRRLPCLFNNSMSHSRTVPFPLWCGRRLPEWFSAWALPFGSGGRWCTVPYTVHASQVLFICLPFPRFSCFSRRGQISQNFAACRKLQRSLGVIWG